MADVGRPDQIETGVFVPQIDQYVLASKTYENEDAKRPIRTERPTASLMGVNDTNRRRYVVLPTGGRTIVDYYVSENLLWGGNLPGDIYGSRDIKGSRVSLYDQISIDESSPYGLRALGLKDNVGLELIPDASLKLRELGLPTELPVKFYKLHEVMGVYIGLWKLTALTQFAIKSLSLKDTLKAAKYIYGTDFFLEERDLQVAERLRDLAIGVKNQEQFRSFMEPIFRWLNVATKVRSSGLISGTPQPEPFKYCDDDIKRYFGIWLPEQMGIYLARAHKNKIGFGYLHAQNWSMVGTVYDLDSVSGVREVKKFQGMPDMTKDFEYTLGAIRELYSPFLVTEGNYLSDHYPDIFKKARLVFVESYFTNLYEPNEIYDAILKYRFNEAYPGVISPMLIDQSEVEEIIKLVLSSTQVK